MSEGYWIRIDDDRTFDIMDHAMDFVSDESLSKKMGIHDVYREIKKENLKPTKDNEDRKKYC